MVQIAAEITYSQWCCGWGAAAPGGHWREEQKWAGCGPAAGPVGWICWTHTWELLYHSAGCSSASQTPGGWSLWSSLWATMRRTTIKFDPTSVCSACMHVCSSAICDNVGTVYLLWDVIYTVLVQEQLYEAIGYASRHLFQGVVSQIELHEALQVLECVLFQVTVTQLKERSSLTLHIPKQHSVVNAHKGTFKLRFTWLKYRSSSVRFPILLKAPAGILEIRFLPRRSCSRLAGSPEGTSFRWLRCA